MRASSPTLLRLSQCVQEILNGLGACGDLLPERVGKRGALEAHVVVARNQVGMRVWTRERRAIESRLIVLIAACDRVRVGVGVAADLQRFWQVRTGRGAARRPAAAAKLTEYQAD